MYICNDCLKKFDYVKIHTVYVEGRPVRKKLCPFCESKNYVFDKGHYCKCCGRSLGNSNKEYCREACRHAGERLWAKQAENKEKAKNDPLINAVREVEEYNKKTGKNLSYGRYFYLKGANMI